MSSLSASLVQSLGPAGALVGAEGCGGELGSAGWGAGIGALGAAVPVAPEDGSGEDAVVAVVGAAVGRCVAVCASVSAGAVVEVASELAVGAVSDGAGLSVASPHPVSTAAETTSTARHLATADIGWTFQTIGQRAGQQACGPPVEQEVWEMGG